MAGLPFSVFQTPMKGRLSRFGAALLLASVPAACAPAGEIGPAETAAPITIGKSLTGNYLAGRHAQVMRDTGPASRFYLEALTHDPENLPLLQRTFLATAADGQMEEAIDIARRVIAQKDDAMVATYALVAEDLRAGRFAEAAERIGAQPVTGINMFMVPLLKAWALAGQGETDKAMAALEPMAENDSFRPLRNLHAALILDLAGRMEDAEKAYLDTIAEQEDPTLRMILLIGNHFERSGKPDRALEFYRKYLERRPETRHIAPALLRLEKGEPPLPDVANAADGAAEVLFGITSSLNQQNARETALVFGRLALYLRPVFPIIQMQVGGILEDNNRLEAANALYAGVPDASPFAWSARLRRASNLDALGQTEDAIAEFRRMADDAPTDPNPLINMGDVLRGRERFEEAAEAYDEAIDRVGDLRTHHWSLLYARGIARERSGKWNLAEKDFLKALEFNPDQPYVLNYLGYSWVEKGQHFDKAQDMIKKAVSLRPNDGYIVDSLGWVYYQLGNFTGAVKELERAVELKPDDPVINDHLGDAYWKVGRRKEARFQWRRSLGLKPESDLRETVEKKLKHGLAEADNDDGNG